MLSLTGWYTQVPPPQAILLPQAPLPRTFADNGGTATAASITGAGHTVPSNTVPVNISLTGDASGVETIVLKPAANSVYDGAGNAAVTTDTTGTLTFNDKRGPALTSVSIASNNDNDSRYAKPGNTVTVTFEADENLQTPTVTIAGNTATVSGSNKNWTAEYQLDLGDPDGLVSFTISGIQDTQNNSSSDVVAVTDGTSVTYYIDPPAIIDVELADDNTYIDITFDRAVYTANDGTGALVTDDFNCTYSKNTGFAADTTISGINHPEGGNVVTLDLDVDGLCNGDESIEININADAIYGIEGLVVPDTETTGTVLLNSSDLDLVSVEKIEINPMTVELYPALYGKKISAIDEIVVTFSDGVLNADDPHNYSISGSGAGTLTVPPAAIVTKDIGTNVYHIPVKGTPQHGSITISIDGGITNQIGFALTGNTSFSNESQKPCHAVLVLDYSGTMTEDVTINIVEGSTTTSVEKPKIDFLRDAASALVDLWNEVATNGDMAEVVYFNSHAKIRSDLSVAMSRVHVMDPAMAALLIDGIEDAAGGGCTSMGAGLAYAHEILDCWNSDPESVNRKRYVILFTDGMQNRNPLVHKTLAPSDAGYDSSPLEINTVVDPVYYPEGLDRLCGTYDNNGSSHYTGTLPIAINDSIKILTLGIGNYGVWQEMLADVSGKSGGTHYQDSVIWDNLSNFFTDNIVSMFGDSSPQVVCRSKGIVKQNEGVRTESFVLNKSVNKLIIYVNWPSDIPLNVRLYKNNAEISLAKARITDGRSYKIVSVDLPIFQLSLRPILHVKELSALIPDKGSLSKRFVPNAGIQSGNALGLSPFHYETINAEGEWKVEIFPVFTGCPDAPFSINIIADDASLHFNTYFPGAKFRTGDKIPIRLSVTDMGRPVENLFVSKVTITGPARDMGTIVSKYSANAADTKTVSTDADCSLNQLTEKLLVIQKDVKTYTQIVERKIHTRTLSSLWKTKSSRFIRDKGIFKSNVFVPEIPGAYKVDFTFKGTGKNCGVFERTATLGFHVKLKADGKKSQIRVSKWNKESVSVMLTPSDMYGNRLGPGHGNGIALVSKSVGSVSVVDNQNGSYVITAKIKNREHFIKGTVAICVSGERIWSGEGKDLPMKRWRLIKL